MPGFFVFSNSFYMKLVLKIALGVFLGVSGVLIVRSLINSNLGLDSRISSLKREIRSAAIRYMTPDSVIEKCGEPLRDVTDQKKPSGFYGFGSWRHMYYRNSTGSLVLLTFIDKDGSGSPPFIQLVNDLNDRGTNKDTVAISGEEEILKQLPCMDSDKRVR